MAYTLTVTISPAGAGGIVLSPIGDYVGPGQRNYAPGTTVSLEAIVFIADSYFDHWEGDLSGDLASSSITMNSNKSITAVFHVPAGPTIRDLTTSVVGSGSVSPSSGIYNDGDQIVIVATPGSGYVFDSWSGDIDGTSPVPGMPNNLNVTMNKDRHIIATFTSGGAPSGISEFKVASFSKV